MVYEFDPETVAAAEVAVLKAAAERGPVARLEEKVTLHMVQFGLSQMEAYMAVVAHETFVTNHVISPQLAFDALIRYFQILREADDGDYRPRAAAQYSQAAYDATQEANLEEMQLKYAEMLSYFFDLPLAAVGEFTHLRAQAFYKVLHLLETRSYLTEQEWSEIENYLAAFYHNLRRLLFEPIEE